MKRKLVTKMILALALSSSLSYAAIDGSTVKLYPTAYVDRHCRLSLTDQNGSLALPANNTYEVGGDALNFGNIYKDASAPAEYVEKTTNIYVQCNDDFKLTARSVEGGMKLDRADGAAKLVDYQVSEASVGAISLISPSDAVMTSSMKSQAREMNVSLVSAQSTLSTDVVDTSGSIKLKIAKGQYPVGSYVDTVIIELASQ